jgi:hypothetical protein
MLPVIESKMKSEAAGVPPPGGVSLNSVVVLPTVPVGRPPGMVMVCVPALSVTGAPPTSPVMSCVVLVPLLATQKGLVFLKVMPHGLTRSGSRTGAKPGMSEMSCVTR